MMPEVPWESHGQFLLGTVHHFACIFPAEIGLRCCTSPLDWDQPNPYQEDWEMHLSVLWTCKVITTHQTACMPTSLCALYSQSNWKYTNWTQFWAKGMSKRCQKSTDLKQSKNNTHIFSWCCCNWSGETTSPKCHLSLLMCLSSWSALFSLASKPKSKQGSIKLSTKSASPEEISSVSTHGGVCCIRKRLSNPSSCSPKNSLHVTSILTRNKMHRKQHECTQRSLSAC